MANVFSGSEIVELGIQIEKNGRDFYNVLTKQAKNKKAGDMFKYLAGEEEKHIAVFKEILSSIQRYEPKAAYPGEYFAYMNALAGEYVFTKKDKGSEIAKKINSDKEAVDMGIGFEKDSILFYVGIKEVVPEEGHKPIDALIVQERDHLKQLVNLKKNL